MDARPSMEGKTLLASMVALGVSCTYVQLNALSYIMADVSKVFIGAAVRPLSGPGGVTVFNSIALIHSGQQAMMNNGTVLGRAGTAMVNDTAFALCAPLPPWPRRRLSMASTASAAQAPLFPLQSAGGDGGARIPRASHGVLRDIQVLREGPASRRRDRHFADTPLYVFVGVSIVMERERQQNDRTLANGSITTLLKQGMKRWFHRGVLREKAVAL